MEDLLGFVIVIVAIVSSIMKKKKKMEQTKAFKAVQPVHTAKPEAPAVPASTGSIKEQTHEGLHPCDEHTAASQQVAQPRVQVMEKPLVVMGSMGVDAHEGLHPCEEHDDRLAQRDRSPMAEPVEQEGIQLDWTGENMVKAFIMQEVLTRPCQRRRA